MHVFPLLCLNVVYKSTRRNIVITIVIGIYRPSTMSGHCNLEQTHYNNVVFLRNLFTGLGFYGIAKMQRYLIVSNQM